MGMKRTIAIKGAEWANKHFRLAAGSSQEEGFWETLPLQVVPLNMMCNRAIAELTMQKSARVGWSKLVIAANTCLHAQFKTNSVIYVPTESDAKNISVTEIELREDLQALREIGVIELKSTQVDSIYVPRLPLLLDWMGLNHDFHSVSREASSPE